MTATLGRLIGEGRTAEVYEFGNGRVIKLMRTGLPERELRSEAAKTAAASAAGAPAPRVHGVEEVNGRAGIVFDIAGGEMMLDLILRAPHRMRRWGKVLAETHHDLLTRTSEILPDMREILDGKIAAAEALEPSERAAAREALSGLPGGTSVLHGDFHPQNVYLSGAEATVIDWVDAARGPIEADIVRSMWLTSAHVIPPDFPRRWAVVPLAKRLGRSYHSHILGTTGRADADLAPWRLPVLAGRLSERIPYEEAILLGEVRRLLSGT